MAWNRSYEMPRSYHDARLLLHLAGHITSFNDLMSATRITLSGFAYLEELKHPVSTWLKRNWFAAMVAGATLLLALVSSFAQLVVAFRT